MSFSGTSNFTHNSADVGGAISIADNVVVTFSGTNNFIGNSASNGSGGAIIATRNTSLHFFGTSDFSYNSAGNHGGAIARDGNVIVAFKMELFNNSAVMVVVQSLHLATPCWILLVLMPSVKTQQVMKVVQLRYI